MTQSDLGGNSSITSPSTPSPPLAPPPQFTWILYSKPGCHLCEGLLEKLLGIPEVAAVLTVRDITTNSDWWQRFEYEIPILSLHIDGEPEVVVPRFSPRDSQQRMSRILATLIESHLAKMRHI